MTDWLKENQIYLQALGSVLALLVFGWGVYQYYRSNELAFRKPYWEKLLSLYIEATSNAATLASTDDEAAWQKARNEFWKLYHGTLCLVEDRKVEAAMVEFGALLRVSSFDNRDADELGRLSRELAYACRDSIRNDWRVPLETLSGQSRSALSESVR